jgi:hypothetical protein
MVIKHLHTTRVKDKDKGQDADSTDKDNKYKQNEPSQYLNLFHFSYFDQL